jgi:hypothetical protein
MSRFRPDGRPKHPPGAEQKGKLETRAAIEGGQRGTAACAFCYSYAPPSGGGDVPLMLRTLHRAKKGLGVVTKK